MNKWQNRDRKREKKRLAKKLDSQHKDRSKGKDSIQKKKEAQFRKSLSEFADELMNTLNIKYENS
tara:strand:+ start:915 stop:1109 length:195 start_codon:yes stop_codon:yes gene_type:complete